VAQSELTPAQRIWSWLPTSLQRMLGPLRPLAERVAAVGFIQAAVVLAAQTFMALFPLLIGVVALAPARVSESITTFLRSRMGLAGATTDQVQQLVASRDQLHSAMTIFGALVVLGSATSFTRALQHVYESAWGLPKVGLRGSVRGFFWLIGLVIYVAMFGVMYQLTASHAVGIQVLRAVLAVAGAFVLWWLTPFVLLCGRVRLRALAMTGLLTGFALSIASWLSTVLLPRMVRSSQEQYGIIGAVFALQSWLVVLASLIVGAALLGAFAAESGGLVGRWARGIDDVEAWHRTPTGIFARRQDPLGH
jgi:membrane protein